ncbi:hypothetical protein LCGC14_2353630, partial [marine sediment metagenome]
DIALYGATESTSTGTGALVVIGGIGTPSRINAGGNILGANTVTNETDTYSSHPDVQKVITLTQIEYDAIGTPNANTLYLTI